MQLRRNATALQVKIGDRFEASQPAASNDENGLVFQSKILRTGSFISTENDSNRD
jgi:hypothetical protein